VSVLCLFVDDLKPSNAGIPLRLEGLWVEFFVRG
jgi:hypothetical protein